MTIHEFKIPKKHLLLSKYLCLIWKSTNSSVLSHDHCHQTLNFHAHEIKWFHSIKLYSQVAFDPFSIRHSSSWKQVMDHFNREVVSIENEAKQFIDESFQSLRSAEGAFNLLLKFKHIRSREAINNQMMQKFRDILVQYQKEVEIMDDLFQTQKDEPPLHKNHPPVAGSIYWERSLFHRIKHVIIRFQSMEDMMQSDMGKSVCIFPDFYFCSLISQIKSNFISFRLLI